MPKPKAESVTVELTRTPTDPRWPCPACGKETKDHGKGKRICAGCKQVAQPGVIVERIPPPDRNACPKCKKPTKPHTVKGQRSCPLCKHIFSPLAN